jgi:Uma2 family endonuclease
MNILEKKISYQEFRQMEFDDSDDAWYELINGELVRKQSPTLDHQLVSSEIEFQLMAFSKKTNAGKVLHAPMDVVLDDNNAYHPNIFFVKKERYFIFDEQEKVVIGAPDLVIEILSKSTAADDKGSKKDNYELHGVREYWLVDPIRKSIEVYALVNERFKLISYLEENGVLKSAVLEGFEMEIETVFAEAKIG